MLDQRMHANIKVKNCPRCGSAYLLTSQAHIHHHPKYFFISCGNYLCGNRGHRHAKSKAKSIIGAIRRWNKIALRKEYSTLITPFICIFCGNDNPFIKKTLNTYQIRCGDSCPAEGVIAISEESAIRKWNKRMHNYRTRGFYMHKDCFADDF